jgi:pimeloyl-ACP methyl ester carboxylesterase
MGRHRKQRQHDGRYTLNILKNYVDTPGGQVHYREIPGPGTPIVLLHQTASSSASYEAVMPALASSGLRPIAIDTPGFGQSFDPDDIPSVTYLVEAVLAAINALGLGHFHLFGHHTGACIAVELAATHPDRILSLMLSGPLPMTADEQKHYHGLAGAPFAPDTEGRYLLETWNYLGSHGLDRDLPTQHREVIDHLRAWRTRAMAYSVVWFQDFDALLRSVRAPLMLICAKDDLLFPFFDRARAIRPDATAVLIENGSNFCTDFNPTQVAREVLDFTLRATGGPNVPA